MGTRFKNNGEGNWFMAGVRDALRLAAPILQAIPHPIAQGLGMGAKLAGEVSLAGEDQRPTKPQGGALPKKKKTKAKVNNLAIRNATAPYRDWETDRKSTRLNSSHSGESRMPSSA